MSKSTIPLAKGFNINKINYPAFVSTKYDGVPIKIIVTRQKLSKDIWKHTISAVTRQNEDVISVQNDMKVFLDSLIATDNLNKPITIFVAEVTHETLKSFKDISGVVRRQSPQEGLIYNFFDFDDGDESCFEIREEELEYTLSFVRNRLRNGNYPDKFKWVKQIRCEGLSELETTLEQKQLEEPDEEGHIIRSGDAVFKPNSRHWDYQKVVIDPTIDLRIIDVEEAIDKHGAPKGMVGRLVAKYKGRRIGIGPGKLTHKERKELWEANLNEPDTFGLYSGFQRIATIKYKRDDSYDALRQPTFQHWRPEKTEESYE